MFFVFPWKHKLYYNVVRPIVPISLRKKIQEKVNARVHLKENFIFKEFVDIVSAKQNKHTQSGLYRDSASSAIVLTHDVEEEEGLKFVPKLLELENE